MPETSSNTPIYSTLASDPSMRELVEHFARELPSRAAEIEHALSSSDLQRLSHLTHQLKGAAGGYGFAIITDAARSVERSVREADLAAAAVDIRALADLCRRATVDPEPSTGA